VSSTFKRMLRILVRTTFQTGGTLLKGERVHPFDNTRIKVKLFLFRFMDEKSIYKLTALDPKYLEIRVS
jgi:hypothetical protein